MIPIRRLLLVFLAVSLPAVLAAQSLGDAAARERAKREQKARQGKPPGKVYSNTDLAEPGKPAQSAGSAAAAPPAPAPTGESPGARREREEAAGISPSSEPGGSGSEPGGSGAENESEQASWKQRATSARAPLTQAEAELAQIDAQIASIREQLSPMKLGGPEPDTNRQLALRDELTQAETQRASAQNAVEEARKAWQGFLDGAKSAGVPAGWLEGSPR